MKWLANLFAPAPEAAPEAAQLSPYGRQILASMSMTPDEWSLGEDVASHPTFGGFRHTTSGWQPKVPTTFATGDVKADKKYRRFNRYDRAAIAQRIDAMLESELIIETSKTEQSHAALGPIAQRVGAALGMGPPTAPPLKATELRAKMQETAERIAQAQQRMDKPQEAMLMDRMKLLADEIVIVEAQDAHLQQRAMYDQMLSMNAIAQTFGLKQNY
jgi:hypothetical protein